MHGLSVHNGESPIKCRQPTSVMTGGGSEVDVGHLTVTDNASEMDLCAGDGIGPEPVPGLGSTGVKRRTLLACTKRPRGERYPMRVCWPPSTGSRAPVMKPASSLARKATALATSHAVPMVRRSGTMASR